MTARIKPSLQKNIPYVKNVRFNWKPLPYYRHLCWLFHSISDHVWELYNWKFDNHKTIWWIRTGQPEYSILHTSSCFQSQKRTSIKKSHDVTGKNQSYTTYKKTQTEQVKACKEKNYRKQRRLRSLNTIVLRKQNQASNTTKACITVKTITNWKFAVTSRLKRNSREQQKPTWFKHLINSLDTPVQDMNTFDSELSL